MFQPNSQKTSFRHILNVCVHPAYASYHEVLLGQELLSLLFITLLLELIITQHLLRTLQLIHKLHADLRLLLPDSAFRLAAVFPVRLLSVAHFAFTLDTTVITDDPDLALASGLATLAIIFGNDLAQLGENLRKMWANYLGWCW
jgi:hypothetical protein